MRSEVTEIFFSIYGPTTKRAGRQKKDQNKRNTTKQQQKKRGSVICSTDQENKANMMFTLWLPVEGTGKVRKQLQDTLQDTRFDSHLTGVKRKNVLLAHENINT